MVNSKDRVIAAAKPLANPKVGKRFKRNRKKILEKKNELEKGGN